MRDNNIARNASFFLLVAGCGLVSRVKITHEIFHHGRCHRIQTGRGLIIHHDLLEGIIVVRDVLLDDGPRESGTLLHATTQLSRISILYATQPDLSERLLYKTFDDIFRQIAVLI